jgi:methyl-accepting chemotaxis protein
VLGNLSLRPKIALILLLPVAALLLLAGLRIGSSVSTSRQAAQVRDLTEFALRGTALAHELQRERGLTLGGLLAGRPGTGLRDQPGGHQPGPGRLPRQRRRPGPGGAR